MTCACVKYDDLECVRSAVSKRIKESRALRQAFQRIAVHANSEHALYECQACKQLWQESRAWNWGNEKYMFKVPYIHEDEWHKEVFVQPDDLLVFTAVAGGFFDANNFVEGSSSCNKPGCPNKAVEGLVSCLQHHFESLQRIQTLPPYPSGRWFGPYIRSNIVPFSDNASAL